MDSLSNLAHLCLCKGHCYEKSWHRGTGGGQGRTKAHFCTRVEKGKREGGGAAQGHCQRAFLLPSSPLSLCTHGTIPWKEGGRQGRREDKEERGGGRGGQEKKQHTLTYLSLSLSLSAQDQKAPPHPHSSLSLLATKGEIRQIMVFKLPLYQF